jgi:hypothetical protein
MSKIANLFPETYETSRKVFRDNLAIVRNLWPQSQLFQHRLLGDEDLTIDWISSDALEENKKVFILTTGEHGVEGYVGSAMLQRFIDLYMVRFNADETGLLLVHAINPWGMKYKRRTNANNVDLNRNFVWDPELIDPAFNLDQRQIDGFVNPRWPVGSYWGATFSRMVRLPFYILKMGGFREFKKVSLLGQYRNRKGVHYGGDQYQEETLILMKLYRDTFRKYGQILHLDIHTGYGPRYQMSLVNSVFEKGNSQAFVERFGYPLIVAANTDEFYELRGDMIDYVYALWQQEYSEKRLYANSFEFGTYGDSIWAMIRSMHAIALESQAYGFGCSNEKTLNRVKQDFQEVFFPQAEDWQIKAVADADQAFEGILNAEGYFG